MTVVVISKINWNVTTYRNVTSITHNATNTVINDGTTKSFANADFYVRIMEN